MRSLLPPLNVAHPAVAGKMHLFFVFYFFAGAFLFAPYRGTHGRPRPSKRLLGPLILFFFAKVELEGQVICQQRP